MSHLAVHTRRHTADDARLHHEVAHGRRVRFLSYNIQAGIASQRYRDYVTQSWKHVLPSQGRDRNLTRIAHSLAEFDFVALQEVDAGSLRTNFTNQARFLAEHGGFPVWYHQTNRRFGRLAQHGIALLSRFEPHTIDEHRLPGVRGRGALIARFGHDGGALALFVVHLALGKRSRGLQLGFLRELVNEFPHAVVMGDLNCEADSRELRDLLDATGLRPPPEALQTFPSWRPRRHIDHILVSDGLMLERAYSPSWLYSDHLPVAVDVLLPEQIVPYQ